MIKRIDAGVDDIRIVFEGKGRRKLFRRVPPFLPAMKRIVLKGVDAADFDIRIEIEVVFFVEEGRDYRLNCLNVLVFFLE